MRQVTVSKGNLLLKLRANRDAHRSLFLKAQEGYRAAVIEELDRMLAEARTGKPIRRAINLAEPQDHTEDYDRVIAMAEMEVGDIIELTDDEFAQYVLDQWDWRHLVLATNTAYAARVG